MLLYGKDRDWGGGGDEGVKDDESKHQSLKYCQ